MCGWIHTGRFVRFQGLRDKVAACEKKASDKQHSEQEVADEATKLAQQCTVADLTAEAQQMTALATKLVRDAVG